MYTQVNQCSLDINLKRKKYLYNTKKGIKTMKKKKGVKIISRGMNNTSAKEARELADYYDDLFRQYRQTGNVSQETLDAVGRTGFEDDDDSDEDDHSYDDSFMAGINEMLGCNDHVGTMIHPESSDDNLNEEEAKPKMPAIIREWAKKHTVRPISLERNMIDGTSNLINIQSMQKHGRTIDLNDVRYDHVDVNGEDAVANSVPEFKESLDSLFPAIFTYASSIVNPVIVISTDDFVNFIHDTNMTYVKNMRFRMLGQGRCAIYLIDDVKFRINLDSIHMKLLNETVTVATSVLCKILAELTNLQTCCAADLVLYNKAKNPDNYHSLCEFINTSTGATEVTSDSDEPSDMVAAYLGSMNENQKVFTTEAVDEARETIINWVTEYAPDDDDTEAEDEDDEDVDSEDTDQELEETDEDDVEEVEDLKSYNAPVIEEVSDSDDDEEDTPQFGTPLFDKLKGLKFAASKEAAAEIDEVDDIDLTNVAVHTKG